MKSNRTILTTTILVFVLSLAINYSGCKPTPKTPPTATAIHLNGGGDSYVEITAAVTAPVGDGPCKDGMILAGAGDGTERILMGSLRAPFPSSYDVASWEDTKWTQTGSLETPPTMNKDLPLGSDNQSATLANGDLILMWNGGTMAERDDSASLSWWNDWGTKGNTIDTAFAKHPFFPQGQRNGFRGALIIWRYSCAQEKWLKTTMLDAAEAVALDSNNTPQKGYNTFWAPYAGFDREEMYVDPWGVDPNDSSKQRMYVSTRIERPGDRLWEVFMSPDSGATWKPAGIRMGSEAPVVMTSTNNGRLFMFAPSDTGNKPTLSFSDDNGASLSSPDGGYDITYINPNPKPGEQPKFQMDQLRAGVTGVGEAGTMCMSLARTGKNAVLAVYPSLEVVQVNNQPVLHQVAAVVWVVTKEKDPTTGQVEQPIVVPIKIIRAQAPEGSVLMPSFIQDNRTGNNVETNLLYWIETASRPSSNTEPVKMLARYLTFNGIVPDTEKDLSDPGGWELNNRTPGNATGDYMKGSFYADDGNMNFVPVWPQVPPDSPDKVKSHAYIRIITFADSQKKVSAPITPPETMPGHYRALPQARRRTAYKP